MPKRQKYDMDDGRDDMATSNDGGSNAVTSQKLLTTEQSVNAATQLSADQQLFDKAVARVFLFKPRSSRATPLRSVVVMQDVEAIASEELEYILFNRLLMPKSVLGGMVEQNMNAVATDSFGGTGEAIEPNPILYLCESFLRLQALPPSSVTVDQLTLLQRIIMQNIRTGLAVPDIFPDAPPASQQIVDFAFKHFELYGNYVATLLELMLFGGDNGMELAGDPDELLFPIFAEVDNRLKIVNSRGPELVLSNVRTLSPVFFLLSNVCRKTEGAQSFMHYSKINANPSNPRYATACERTLLGRLLYASSCPIRQQRPTLTFEFFPTSVMRNASSLTSAEQFVYGELTNLVDGVFSIVNNIVRTSAEARDLFCRWVGTALASNKHRGRMYDQEAEEPPEEASHGFMLNLLHLLLMLCRPFLSSRDPKLLRINWLYSAVKEPKAHLSILHDETTLVPKPSTSNDGDAAVELPGLAVADASVQSFITAVFFLTHYCVKVGLNSTFEKLSKIRETLGRTHEFLQFWQTAPPSQTAVANVERAKNHLEHIESFYTSLRTMLTCPQRLTMLVNFSLCTAQWCTQLAIRSQPPAKTDTAASAADTSSLLPPLDAFRVPQFPLSESDAPSSILCFVPEICIETVEDVLQRAIMFHHDARAPFELDLNEDRASELVTFVLVFMGSPARMKNPHLRARMSSLLTLLLPPSAQDRDEDEDFDNQRSFSADYEEQRSAVFVSHPLANHVVSTLLHVFCSIELTGTGISFETKFQYRRPMFSMLRFLVKYPVHRAQLDALARDAIVHVENADAPLFLRFASLLCDDATFLLQEGLTYMIKMKQYEKDRDEVWPKLPDKDRMAKQQEMDHYTRLTRFYNVLGFETIDAVKIFTKIDGCVQLLTHPIMSDRLAAMLDYFLFNLVDPTKRKIYKTQNLADYSFEPKKLLAELVNCYSNLGSSSADSSTRFLQSVINDERSYSPGMIAHTLDVLRMRDAGTPMQLEKMQTIQQRLEKMERLKKDDDEILESAGDVPDEFLDRLMAFVMRDPVKLPQSGTVVDRKTIARYLISNQQDPFDRSPLTMDDVQPQPELKSRIEAWLAEKRKAYYEKKATAAAATPSAAASSLPAVLPASPSKNANKMDLD